MKLFYPALISISVIAASPVANASSDMSGMPMPQGGKESAATHKGQGAVEAVDSVAGKLKLNHGPINSLKWPAMTMEFPVKDKKILKGVKPGMRVEFELAPDKDKNYAVIRIKPVQ